jgi:uncharacterized membrane protein
MAEFATVLPSSQADAVSAAATSSVRPRLDSVDLLRGLAMVFMLLDHTRDFIMNPAISPTNMATTTPGLFFTRWITHFCAPTFMLLAGTGAFLSLQRRKSKSQLSWFLFTRGLWMILLEVTIGRWGLTFNLHYGGFVWLLVLWSLGCAMIFLAGLIHLPRWAIGAICLAMIVGHNAFDGVRATQLGAFAPLWTFLHQPGPIPVFGGVLFVGYPWIAWIAVIGVGYLLGPVLLETPARRKRKLLTIGIGITLAFLLLRAINVYGDPNAWKAQGSAIMTLCSFLNCTKQPPSLIFLTMTLGPALILLALFDRRLPNWTRPVITFGRVPLFFYLLNFPVALLLGITVAAMTGQDFHHFLAPLGPFEPAPAGFGHGLAITYLAWLIGLLILYPLCLWFSRIKARNKAAWLSYL